MTVTRTRVRIGLAVVLLLAGGLFAVHLQDRMSQPRYDYAPVLRESALDTWTEPWAGASSGAEPESAGQACSSDLPRRWLVVGWDAADWRLILPLVEAGELPNLEHLMQGGAYGTLASFLPSISPSLWTSVATGVSPAEHGILGFYDREPRLVRWWKRLAGFGRLDRELFSNADRRVKAVWNLLSEAGRRVLVVGYHNTFPVEPVSGAMVSNYLVQDAVGENMSMHPAAAAGGAAGGLVHPAALLEELLAIQRQAQQDAETELWRFAEIPEAEREAFLAEARTLDRDGDRRPYFLLRSYLFDSINARVARRLYPRVAPDAAFVHFQSADWATHQFLYFHEPERFADRDWPTATRARLDAQLPRYRSTVAAFYRWLDEELGRLLELVPEGTAVVVLSDHGVGPGDDPDIPGYHDDGPPGMIVVSGPGIRPGRLSGASLYDVLPTLVAALGLPVAEDLEGRVLVEAFCDGALPEPRTVASYEEGERYTPVLPKASGLERDVLEQLESLGYIDD